MMMLYEVKSKYTDKVEAANRLVPRHEDGPLNFCETARLMQ
jgi:hypothetical protein